MTKKIYMQPTMTVTDVDLKVQILTSSVQTTGLDDDNLEKDDTPGDAWSDAMSRRSVWDNEELLEDEEEEW